LRRTSRGHFKNQEVDANDLMRVNAKVVPKFIRATSINLTWRMKMKKLIIAATAVALVLPSVSQLTGLGGAGAFAQQQQSAKKKTPKPPMGPNTPNDVYCNGTYLGSDPDPQVRLKLLKDFDLKNCGGN
jgi:hypothetical protein